MRTVIAVTLGPAAAVCVASGGYRLSGAGWGYCWLSDTLYGGVLWGIWSTMHRTPRKRIALLKTHRFASSPLLRTLLVVACMLPGAHPSITGSVQVTKPAPWWKRWSSKGLMSLYVPQTTDDTYAVTATRVIEAPSGAEFVFPSANSMTVNYKGKTILDAVVDADSVCGQNQAQSRHGRQQVLRPIEDEVYGGYIEYAHQEHVSGLTDFTAYWDVPTVPTAKNKTSYITLWTGIGGNNGDGVVQPVLEWDHQKTGKYWTIAAWAVRNGKGDSDCGPGGHSERRNISTGNKIQGRLYYMNSKWNIEITDMTRGGTTKCSSNVVGISDVEVFGGVLEGWYLRYAENDKNLPGSTKFYDMSYNTRVSLMGSVEPNATAHFKDLRVEIVKNPSLVILHTANSG